MAKMAHVARWTVRVWSTRGRFGRTVYRAALFAANGRRILKTLTFLTRAEALASATASATALELDPVGKKLAEVFADD